MPLFPLTDPPNQPGDAILAARDRGMKIVRDEEGLKVDAEDEAAAAAVQAFLDGYDHLALERARAADRVAKEAERRIDLLASPRVRENLAARGIQLLDKLASGQALTPEEESDRLLGLGVYSAVLLIREAQAQIVAELAGYTSSQALDDLDPSASPHWP